MPVFVVVFVIVLQNMMFCCAFISVKTLECLAFIRKIQNMNVCNRRGVYALPNKSIYE